jgi:uncharacterized membrane protein YraQ (UPF0718 family)
MEMLHQFSWFGRSLYEAAAMFWEVLWALILGFGVSAVLQVFVSKEQMTRALGKAGLREVALATALGAASSSCSYAASAAARTAFKRGAALVPALAFMFASTNLVFELGIVLWILMGWRFVLAEGVGAFVLIGVMWLLVALTLPNNLEQEARAHEETDVQGGCCHDHAPESGPTSKLASVVDAFRMDWGMMGKEMAVGFLVAGFLTVLIPDHAWRTLFLTQSGSPSIRLLENAVVGPLIAMASFVCSIGNIPLASILWSGGISFGGVISFIYADLIIIPLIIIYAKYYGWRAAIYITGILFASMVAAGLIVDLLFSGLHLVPTGPRPASALAHAHFAWNYSTWLDLFALGIVAILAVLRFRERVSAQEEHCGDERHSCEHHGLS